MVVADPGRSRTRRLSLLFVGALLAALAVSALLAPPASADEVNIDKYDYIFSGNVKFNDKPLADVKITVSGNGYKADVKTDNNGQWKVGVPRKEKYTITLDEGTLPNGVIVAQGSNVIEAEFGLTNNKSVNFFLGEGVREVTSFTDQLISRAISGLNFGLMLALASIGLSLIYGTTGLANFAHAEFVTFGAVMALTFGVQLAFPLWIAFPLAIVLTGVLGWILDIGLWKPLRKKGLSVVQLMIVSIGLSLALRYVFLYFYGGGTYPLPDTGSAKITLLGPIALSRTDMISAGPWWESLPSVRSR